MKIPKILFLAALVPALLQAVPVNVQQPSGTYTDNSLVRRDGTGNLVQNGVLTEDDFDGTLNGPQNNTTTTAAGSAFTNQPSNDGVEVLSSNAGDTTQTVTIIGTTTATNTVVVETVTLNGTTFVPTVKTNWGLILAVKKSAATLGTVTVRKATGDGTITAGLTAAVLSVGVNTVSAGNQPAYNRTVSLVASGASTGQIGLQGTDSTGATIYDSKALTGTTAVVSNSAFLTVTEIYTGDLSGAVTGTETADGTFNINAGGTTFTKGQVIINVPNFGNFSLRSTAALGAASFDMTNTFEGVSPYQIFASNAGGAQIYSFGSGTGFFSANRFAVNSGSKPGVANGRLYVKGIAGDTAAGSPTLNVVSADTGNSSFTVLNDGTTNVVAGELQTAGNRVNYNLSAYLTGTVYTFTNTATAVTGGTTSPTITINKAGTYLIFGQVQMAYAGATVVTETATVKLRRTNNTAADLTSGSTTIDLPTSTVLTYTYGTVHLPQVIYTTSNATDVITLFANVSATLGAGTITAEANGTFIQAIRLY